jgi:hypothetical protein
MLELAQFVVGLPRNFWIFPRPAVFPLGLPTIPNQASAVHLAKRHPDLISSVPFLLQLILQGLLITTMASRLAKSAIGMPLLTKYDPLRSSGWLY